MNSTTFSHLSHGSFSSSIGDSWELEGNLPLKDRLKAFKTSQFDHDVNVTTKCHAMSDKCLAGGRLVCRSSSNSYKDVDN
ncbi:hypothetical protein ACFX1R_022531 [Malus domestica]